MRYRTKGKTNQAVEDLIVWTEISSYLTNSKDAIRKNRIPKAHNDKIEELFKYIQAWKNDVKLFSADDLTQALDKTDLKTIIMVRMGLLDQ